MKQIKNRLCLYAIVHTRVESVGKYDVKYYPLVDKNN